MDQSVHQTTTISTHVGSLIQIIVVCPYKHTNLMTSPTYGGDYFLVGLPDQFPVNISESTERMLAGEWSGRLAGNIHLFKEKLMKLHNGEGHKIKIYIKKGQNI